MDRSMLSLTPCCSVPDPFFHTRHNQVIQLTASHDVPAAWLREFLVAGRLTSYGSRIEERFRQVGIYTGRILNGPKPADLPIQRATKIGWYARAAKALGLEIPRALLTIAYEVVE
jgi:putative ABC transport system substrate-binding protein